MAVGKRSSSDDPLTEHDAAERLDKALLRALRILMDIRQISPEFFTAVKDSRYLTNCGDLLVDELRLWGFTRHEPTEGADETAWDIHAAQLSPPELASARDADPEPGEEH